MKHIHFVGIKGVGMTPLAIIAKEAGFEVTGSDTAELFITDESLANAGIVSFTTFSPEHIKEADLIITTGAHGGYSNPEVVAAKEKKIDILTQGQAVGVCMQGDIFNRSFSGISVAGTHGKTTTTGIIATLLKDGGLDPSYVIGTSDVPSLPAPGHLGLGEYFVAEADEYATEPQCDQTPKFLWQSPTIAVITNIEHDHPDVYETMDDVRKAFTKFVSQIKPGGTLIANGDDPEIKKLLNKAQVHFITYGFGNHNDYFVSSYKIENGKILFTVSKKGQHMAEFETSLIGKHNLYNSLAAIITALSCGIGIGEIQAGLLLFKSSKRRLEYKGKLPSGSVLYDDYAHHPTEIRATLAGLKELYPTKKIVSLFQPHTYSRTKLLLTNFSKAFLDADEVLLTDIYASKREEADESISSSILREKIKEEGQKVAYLPTLTDMVQYVVNQSYNDEFVLVTMGAGDIYKIGEALHISSS